MGSTMSPVSSLTSRTRPSVIVSSRSRMPPGGSQWALSRRCMTSARASSSITTPATLTEWRLSSPVTFVTPIRALRGTLESTRRPDKLSVPGDRGRGIPHLSSVLDGLAVDPASDRAVFRQIADQLRTVIRDGRLSEGARLPSEAALIEHYGVARMTVRNALQLLETEGLTRAEHGRGVYVRRKPPVRRLASDRFARRHRKDGKAAFIAESEQFGARPDVDMIQVNEMPAPPEIAERLNRTGEVIVRSRRYSLNGTPVETATSYIPADVARGTPIADPNPGPGGIYARLE